MRILLLVFLSFAFRWPVLSRAASLHSDAAIVGLQTRHMMQGEWAPFLHGSGYQSSTDAVLAIPWFALFGAEPWVLLAATLALHALYTLCIDAILRHVGLAPWRAFALCLALVFTPPPIHTYALYPPRQAAITLAGLAMLAAVRAVGPRMAALACAAAGAAVYADPYAQVFLPGVAILLLAKRSVHTTRTWGAIVAGSFAGAALPYWLRHRSDASIGQMAFGFEPWRTERAWHILRNDAAAWITSARAYVPGVFEGHHPWHAPPWFHGVQLVGATTLVLGAMSAGVLVFRASIRWETRLAGIAGLSVWGLTLGAFFVSVMVMDLYSTRYLAALVLTAPLALAPLASLLPSSRASLTAASAWCTYLCAAGVSGWLGFAPLTDGWRVTDHASGTGVGEAQLLAACKEHGVQAVMTDYWAAYRLAFLWHEEVVAMPPTAHEDRYPPYRAEYMRSAHVAYVHDAARSRETLAVAEALARAQGRVMAHEQVGAFTVWWVEKAAGEPPFEPAWPPP